MELSPIALFVYNRPEHTRKTIEALLKNGLASKSELYIFSDGPKNENAVENVNKVRNYINSIQGFKRINIIENQNNKGLADSIVDGVTKVINKYGKIIVLEDDIVTTEGFLTFMNDALNLYENESRIMHVSGYNYPIKTYKKTIYFLRILSCWGWGTWKRAWDNYEPNTKIHLSKLKNENEILKFNIEGHADFYQQLLDNYNGIIHTWAVKWYASWYAKGGLSLFPSKSLIENIGFDESGNNCIKSDIFKSKITNKIIIKKKEIIENKRIREKIDSFYKNQNNKKNRWSEFARKLLEKIIIKIVPTIGIINRNAESLQALLGYIDNSKLGMYTKIYKPAKISNSHIGDFTYVSYNAQISNSQIGKFCSIGPNFCCGWGIHPTNGISTSPMFYSTLKQNGITISTIPKVEERKEIVIGNDVFIGMNVTVLDGVEIGDGAIIGAGAIVTENIPPYAIAVGLPAKVIKYRFNEQQINNLLKIRWWANTEKTLSDVEKHFFEIDTFIMKHMKNDD